VQEFTHPTQCPISTPAGGFHEDNGAKIAEPLHEWIVQTQPDMSMGEREQMISTIYNLTGPLGPMVSFEQRLKDIENWRMGLGRHDIQVLEGVLKMALGDLEASGIDPGEAYAETAEALGSLADRFPNEILRIFRDCLPLPHLTCIVLDALGNWGDHRGVPLIGELISRRLEEEVAVSVVSALGMMGGPEATGLLSRLEVDYRGLPSVQKEIEIARTTK
jgi:hypothetical protein